MRGGPEIRSAARVDPMTGTQEPITVLVVDDHPIWREGVARDLTERGLQVVGTAGDPASAVRMARAVRPRVVLMDLDLGGGGRGSIAASASERGAERIRR